MLYAFIIFIILKDTYLCIMSKIHKIAVDILYYKLISVFGLIHEYT